MREDRSGLGYRFGLGSGLGLGLESGFYKAHALLGACRWGAESRP